MACATIEEGWTPDWTLLPTEIWLRVFRRLDFKDLLQAERTSAAWCRLLRKEAVGNWTGDWGLEIHFCKVVERLIPEELHKLSESQLIKILLPTVRWLADRVRSRGIHWISLFVSTCQEYKSCEMLCEGCKKTAAVVQSFLPLLAGYLCGSEVDITATIHGPPLGTKLFSEPLIWQRLANHVADLRVDGIAISHDAPLESVLLPICWLTRLVQLELYLWQADHTIHHLPTQICQLKELDYLKLSFFQYCAHRPTLFIPSTVGALSQLHFLEVQGFSLACDHLLCMPALRNCDARSCAFWFDPFLRRSNGIEVLRLTCVHLEGYLTSLAALSSLQYLKFDRVVEQAGHSCASSIANIVMLTHLELAHSAIAHGGVLDLGRLSSLQKLSIASMPNTPLHLPASASQLTEVTLEKNGLFSLQPVLGLTALRVLCLSGNKLSCIPANVTQLQALEKLDLESQELCADLQVRNVIDFVKMPRLAYVYLSQAQDHAWSVGSLLYLAESQARLRFAGHAAEIFF